MMRLFSILLILVGLGAVALGFMAWTAPQAADVSERTASVESAPAAPAPPSDLAPGLDEPTFGTASSPTTATEVDALRSVPIAHETPTEASFGQPFDVTLAIDATGAESAAGALPGHNEIVEGVAQVGLDVRAALIGSAFEIEAMSPEDQAISSLTANTWRWKVTPIANGEHDLVLEIYALRGDRALPVRTFRDQVTVKVSAIRQAITMAQTANPLFMVIGGIGSVLGGAFTALRFFSKASGRG